MYGDIMNLVAMRHNGEFASASAIFSQAASAVTEVKLTIPVGYVALLLTHGGYTNKSDVLVEWKNAQKELLFSWDEFPDTFFQDTQIPFTENVHRNEIYIYFTNNSGSIATNLIMQSLLMIPEPEEKAFLEDLQRAADNILGIRVQTAQKTRSPTEKVTCTR